MGDKRKTVLLTGAAGLIGREVMAELARHPERFTIRAIDLPSRKTRAILRPYRDSAEIFWGDIRDVALVARAMEGVDAVLHLAAVLPPRADHEPEHAHSVNAGGTMTVVEAALAANPDMRFVYTSSISLYGDRLANPWIRVGDPLTPSPHDRYAETKLAAEKLVRDAALPWSIFRLTGVFAAKMALSPLMFHMPLETKLEMVTTRDCAYALVRALDDDVRDALVGGTFNLAGGPSCRVTFRECLDRVFEVVGLGPGFLPDEAFAAAHFHCGFYEDTDVLQQILGFQRDSFEDYCRLVGGVTPKMQRVLTRAARPLARWFLLRHSEPYRARRRHDVEGLERFGLQPPCENQDAG